jgi:hypothetical protein
VNWSPTSPRSRRIGKLYGLAVVLSTVNVKTGRNQPTIHQIVEVLNEVDPIDRTSINAWKDEDFVRAVKTTGRKKLIMAALWTEVCLVHPALDAMKDGFEVYPVIDCVAVRRPRRIRWAYSGSSRRAVNPWAGCSSSASCNAIGTERRPRQVSPTFSSRSRATDSALAGKGETITLGATGESIQGGAGNLSIRT